MRNTAVAALGVAAVLGTALLAGAAATHSPTKRSAATVSAPDQQARPTTDRAVVSAQVASEEPTTTAAPLARVLALLPSPDGVGAPDVASAFVLALTNFDEDDSPQTIASRAAVYATPAFAIELHQRAGDDVARASDAWSRTRLALCRPLTADSTTAIFEVTVTRSSDATGEIDHTTYSITVTVGSSRGWRVVGATPLR